ncbi:MAG: thioredoxin-dependent thiol peroxidase [Candidatus Hydrogenedentes bacterium]|nr:thioredoxin-dependent thiol peroxidase [Candidatus Hydrogenedentota bacterium]
MEITVGKHAPVFELSSNNGTQTKLADMKGHWTVLYFYPKDDTPGCTIEATEFRDYAREFKKRGAAILGVSPDSVESHCRFIDKHDLNFTLLADSTHEIAEKYGVWVEKNRYGRTYWGIQRATFLIDPEGKIARIWPSVRPEGHAAEVLGAIDELAK